MAAAHELCSNARPGATLTNAGLSTTYRGVAYASESHVVVNASSKSFKLYWQSGGGKAQALHSTVGACSTAQIGASPTCSSGPLICLAYSAWPQRIHGLLLLTLCP
jgi:hypothetical protein